MSTQTIIIFSIFIIVAIVGSIFIFYYRDFAESLLSLYIAKITVCGNILDELDCYAKDFCAGIYGPSCPDCHDLEFKRCERIPVKVMAQLENEKKLCASTGGEWDRNQYGDFCLCQKAGFDKTFNKTKGCISR